MGKKKSRLHKGQHLTNKTGLIELLNVLLELRKIVKNNRRGSETGWGRGVITNLSQKGVHTRHGGKYAGEREGDT